MAGLMDDQQGLGGLMADPQKMMLLQMGANMLQASQGGPGQGRPSLGSVMGSGAQGALQGIQNAQQMQMQQAQLGAYQEKLKVAKARERRYEEFVKSPDFAQLPPQVRQAIQSGGPEMLDQFYKGNVEQATQGPTGSQREYEMARQQGYGGTFMDYKSDLAKASRAQTNINNITIPAGYQPAPGGGLAAIPGGPADPANPKNISSTQRTAGLYARRIEQSEKDLKSLDGYVPNPVELKVSDAPLGNYMVSDNFQKYDQSRRNFINAVLRRESGAVISEAEFDNANKQYFPMPGDSPDVLKQKEQNRALVLQMMREEAGSAYDTATDTGIPNPEKLRQKYGLE
jgi:hypothetical protein